jgi:hypothetical protein
MSLTMLRRGDLVKRADEYSSEHRPVLGIVINIDDCDSYDSHFRSGQGVQVYVANLNQRSWWSSEHWELCDETR